MSKGFENQDEHECAPPGLPFTAVISLCIGYVSDVTNSCAKLYQYDKVWHTRGIQIS